MKTTLVIMAAGIGSRYGGDKQTDGIGPHGERLMEYAIYDAIRAGFRKVVCIIRPESQAIMEHLIGNRVACFRTADGEAVEMAYAYQDLSSVPAFYIMPPGRIKPFGTAHALLCAAAAVQEPFCVINADDYYGADAYSVMRRALERMPNRGQAVMVGYVLGNTVSRGGSVSRGVCEVRDGLLQGITERLKIQEEPDGSLRDLDSGVTLPFETTVSMNFWGFAPSLFPDLRRYFEAFLRDSARDNPAAECHLPAMVNAEMQAGRLSVRVLPSRARWFGMTYREDREIVAAQLRALHHAGLYPDSLWEARA